MMSPDVAIAWGEWRGFARSLRKMVAGFRAGTIPFTPQAAHVLEDSVSALEATGEVIMQALAAEAGSVVSAKSHAPGQVPEVQPEPRMIHDLEGIYLPEANRGWLKDMGKPVRAKRVGRFTLIEGGRS
jgi:hypothetical protein